MLKHKEFNYVFNVSVKAINSNIETKLNKFDTTLVIKAIALPKFIFNYTEFLNQSKTEKNRKQWQKLRNRYNRMDQIHNYIWKTTVDTSLRNIQFNMNIYVFINISTYLNARIKIQFYAS